MKSVIYGVIFIFLVAGFIILFSDNPFPALERTPLAIAEEYEWDSDSSDDEGTTPDEEIVPDEETTPDEEITPDEGTEPYEETEPDEGTEPDERWDSDEEGGSGEAEEEDWDY